MVWCVGHITAKVTTTDNAFSSDASQHCNQQQICIYIFYKKHILVLSLLDHPVVLGNLVAPGDSACSDQHLLPPPHTGLKMLCFEAQVTQARDILLVLSQPVVT